MITDVKTFFTTRYDDVINFYCCCCYSNANLSSNRSFNVHTCFVPSTNTRLYNVALNCCILTKCEKLNCTAYNYGSKTGEREIRFSNSLHCESQTYIKQLELKKNLKRNTSIIGSMHICFCISNSFRKRFQ